MPRDDWAKARRRDIGRKALRTGNYFRVKKKTKRKRNRPKRKKDRFEVAAGTRVLVCRETEGRWRPHTTRRNLAFQRYERRHPSGYVFLEQGWLLLAKEVDVQKV